MDYSKHDSTNLRPGLVAALLTAQLRQEQDIGSIIALGASQADSLRNIPPLTRLTTRRGLPMCASSLDLKLALVTVSLLYRAQRVRAPQTDASRVDETGCANRHAAPVSCFCI